MLVTQTVTFMKTSALLLTLVLLLTFRTNAQMTYQTPPDPLGQLVDAPTTPVVRVSPRGDVMLWMHPPRLAPIADLAAAELRLAGMRINPRTHGPSRSRGYLALGLKTLDDQPERRISGWPEDRQARNVNFSPDGTRLAFTVDVDDGIHLYVADVATAQARRVGDWAVNNAAGLPYAWMSDSEAMVVLTVPQDRDPVPERPLAPLGPVVQENQGLKAPARTYQDLLADPHDEAVFEYYMTSSAVLVALDGTETAIGPAGLVTGARPSPDGEYILLTAIHRPFSYLVPVFRFPRTYTVYDRQGTMVREIARLPLAENVPTTFGSVATGPRSLNWRADAAATLYWAEALDGGDAGREAELRDEVFMLAAPFEGSPISLAKLALRYGGIQWGDDELALIDERWSATRHVRTWIVNPSEPSEAPVSLFDYSYEDRYNSPGSPMTRPGAWGRRVLHIQDGRLYLTGAGASAEGDRPFLRTLDLETRETETRFQSEAPYYERPVTLLNDGHLLTQRESVDEVPNYYVRDLEAGTLNRVSDFRHPYPELTAITKEYIQYSRADGIPLSATLFLPPGYDKERDGPLPGLVWAYPREFKSTSAAGQRIGSPYRFKYVSYSGAVPYVTQGYAILDGAAMPVIGEGDQEPNDTFREQLVANAQAVIDEGARRGILDPKRVAIAGHSYGAFMTANLLAHSDLFTAGIARSGAYNRTLTPFGFQAEQRLYWESPETYYTMSPFMHADKVNEPILLIHGEADNNSGTYPVQSRRFYSALKGLGKTARLVMLPHESHGYRARESVLHVLWETARWLDTYVKNAPSAVEVAEPTG